MTGTAWTVAPVRCAVRVGASNVGAAVTSDRVGPVNASVAALSSAPEPGVRWIHDRSTWWRLVSASTSVEYTPPG